MQLCIEGCSQPNLRLVNSNNPDLAVVQGAVHFAQMTTQLPSTSSRGGPPHPVAPTWEALTATVSYGILSTQVKCIYSYSLDATLGVPSTMTATVILTRGPSGQREKNILDKHRC